MPPSTGIQPKSGYNFVLFDYLGPQTNFAEVVGYDKPSAGTAWWSIDNTNRKVKLDTIGEYTAAAGVTIDGLQLKDSNIVRTFSTSTPTISASGSMTVSASTVGYCRTIQITSAFYMTFWSISGITLAGTADAEIRIALPVTPSVSTETTCYLYPNITNTGAASAGTAHTHQNEQIRLGCAVVSTAGYIKILQPHLSAYVLGSGYETRGQVGYFV